MARRGGETIPQIIARLGVMEVAYKCRVSTQAVRDWAKGAEMKGKHLVRLAELAGIPVDPRLKKLAGLEDD